MRAGGLQGPRTETTTFQQPPPIQPQPQPQTQPHTPTTHLVGRVLELHCPVPVPRQPQLLERAGGVHPLVAQVVDGQHAAGVGVDAVGAVLGGEVDGDEGGVPVVGDKGDVLWCRAFLGGVSGAWARGGLGWVSREGRKKPGSRSVILPHTVAPLLHQPLLHQPPHNQPPLTSPYTVGSAGAPLPPSAGARGSCRGASQAARQSSVKRNWLSG